MPVDLNTTFGHRPIHIRGEAATTIPHSSFLILAMLSSPIEGQHVPEVTPTPAFKKIQKPLAKDIHIVYNNLRRTARVLTAK